MLLLPLLPVNGVASCAFIYDEHICGALIVESSTLPLILICVSSGSWRTPPFVLTFCRGRGGPSCSLCCCSRTSRASTGTPGRIPTTASIRTRLNSGPPSSEFRHHSVSEPSVTWPARPQVSDSIVVREILGALFPVDERVLLGQAVTKRVAARCQRPGPTGRPFPPPSGS
jgi:hypothetical protein